MNHNVLRQGEPIVVAASDKQWEGIFSQLVNGLLYMWVFPHREDADIGIHIALPLTSIDYIVYVHDRIPIEELEKAIEQPETKTKPTIEWTAGGHDY